MASILFCIAFLFPQAAAEQGEVKYTAFKAVSGDAKDTADAVDFLQLMDKQLADRVRGCDERKLKLEVEVVNKPVKKKIYKIITVTILHTQTDDKQIVTTPTKIPGGIPQRREENGVLEDSDSFRARFEEAAKILVDRVSRSIPSCATI